MLLNLIYRVNLEISALNSLSKLSFELNHVRVVWHEYVDLTCQKIT